MSLLEYEKLCIEVQKFPCIFDKSLASYKESQPKKNAWKCIDEVLGNDPGASLQAWTLLLNRYSKRKSRFKKVNVSGADLATVEKARRSLEEYKFLNWLDGFLRPKTTISNVSLMHLVEDYEDSSCSHAVADNESLPEEQSPAADQQPRKDKKRNAEQEMCGEITTYLKEKKLRRESSNNGADEMFGKFIATEIKVFPENLKYLIKHEINQVIFKHQSLLYSAGSPRTSCQHLDSNTVPVTQPTPDWRYEQHHSSSSAAEESRSVFTEMTPVVFKK